MDTRNPQHTTDPPIPDPSKLQPEGLSNKAKRWMFLGILGVLVLIVLANIIGSPSPAPAVKPQPLSAQQQQNPTAAQIRDIQQNLEAQQAALVQKANQDATRLRIMQEQAGANPSMNDQLARLQDAQARAAAGNQQSGYGNGAPAQSPEAAAKLQAEAEQRQMERKALFADNVVRQDRPQAPRSSQDRAQDASVLPAAYPPPAIPRINSPSPEAKDSTPEKKKPLDFDPSLKTYFLPEGTVIESVLTNRLDGDGVGPVNCLITTDVYLPGTRLVVIPQGARVLGEASKVTLSGQQRLAVAFHRVLVPGRHEYSIPLDGKPPGLAQAGEVGMHDKVNSHYFQIFGASLAIGAIGGLAQIGNGATTLGVIDPSAQFRNGISSSMAQSSEHILDRFLNRLPSITIREGTRTKILLTDDLALPAFERTN